MNKSMLETLFVEQARTSRIADVRDYERQYQFDPVRKWRVDFAWLMAWVALEIEGGIYSGGAHVRPWGVERDIEKGNALTLAGWRLVRASNHMVEDGRAIALIEKLLSARAATPPQQQSPRATGMRMTRRTRPVRARRRAS